MISALAVRITEALCACSAIEESDRELYQYGFFVLLSRVLFFLLTTLFGLLFRVPWESIMFYIMFSLLRGYAGGIHARTEFLCTLLTSFTIILSIAGIFAMKALHVMIVPVGMLIIGMVCILILSPLDTQEKPLSKEDRKRYRDISWILSLLCSVLSIIGILTHHYAILYSAAFAVFLEGTLLVLGRIQA